MAPHRKARTREPDKGKDEDISQLRQPITLHGKPVEQILNSIHYGSPELQNLLLHECDIILECKVCRALFRDLPNFISHKRRYCSKPAAANNHFDIGRLPDERVVVIHPRTLEKLEKTNSCRGKLSSSSSSSRDDSLKLIEKGVKRGKTNVCEMNSKTKTVDDSKCENGHKSLGYDRNEKTEVVSNLNAVIQDVRTVSEDDFVKSSLEPDDDNDDENGIILSPCASQVVNANRTTGHDNQVFKSNSTEKSYSEFSAPVSLDKSKEPISDVININNNNLSNENHRLHLDTNSCEDKIVEADSSSPNSPPPSGTSAGLQPHQDSEINLEMSFSEENDDNSHGGLGVLENNESEEVVTVDVEPPVPGSGTIGDDVTQSEVNGVDVFDSESPMVYIDRDDVCVIENFEKEKKEAEAVKDETTTNSRTEVSTRSQVSTRSSCISVRTKREVKVRNRNIKATQPIHNTRGLSSDQRRERRMKHSLHKSKMSSNYKTVCKSLSGKNSNGRIQKRQRGQPMNQCPSWVRFYNNHISTVKTYMDEKKLVCLKCRTQFQSFNNLKRHIMSKHMGVSRFQCKVCGQKRFDNADIYRHIVKAHGKLENPCHWIVSLFTKESKSLSRTGK